MMGRYASLILLLLLLVSMDNYLLDIYIYIASIVETVNLFDCLLAFCSGVVHEVEF